jgi:putative ABC transport system permease protein
MITDYMRYAVSNLLHRRMRSWLTLIGIFIGIAAIVALISLGQGLKFAVTSQFEALGTDKIILQPGGEIGAPGTGAEAAKLTERELRIVERTPGIDVAAEMQFGIGKVEFNDRNIFTYIIGVPLETKKMEMLKDMTSFKAIEGRMLKQGDNNKAQAGYLLANDDIYFGKKLRVGNKIVLEGHEFEVIGVTGQIGNPQDDTQLIISLEDSDQLFKKNSRYDAIYAKVSDSLQIDGIVEQIKKDIRKLRDEKEGEEDFSVQTTQELLQSFGSILNIITAVLIGIAGISLIVGGVGIMNTMYTSVLERTNEIGIMKAIGAKNSDILMIFLLEAGLIGLVGGIIGILIGVGLGSLAASIAAAALKTTLIQAYFSWYLIVGALAFSMIVGIASGVLPALQASKLKPVDALRYE